MQERYFTDDEIANLLERAHDLGFSLDAGCDLERLTIIELETLVNTRQ